MENVNLNYRVGGLDIFSFLAWNDTYLSQNQSTQSTILGNKYQIDIAMPYTIKMRTRSFVATLTYNFNSTKSKYKGTGAGNEEKRR